MQLFIEDSPSLYYNITLKSTNDNYTIKNKDASLKNTQYIYRDQCGEHRPDTNTLIYKNS